MPLGAPPEQNADPLGDAPTSGNRHGDLASDDQSASPEDSDGHTFLDFARWAERCATNRDAARQAEYLAEGESLASRRRQALKRLIRTDPAKALQYALPGRLRSRLPASVAQNLEERIGGRVFFGLLNADDFDSGTSEFHREVRIGSRTFEAFVYGRRTVQRTQADVFLHGIAIDGLMAVHEDGIRRLDPGERSYRPGDVDNCVVCGASVFSEGPGGRADLGDRVAGFCSETHFQMLNARLAGDSGGSSGAEGPVAHDSWTQGAKRLLFMRVAFPDDPGEPIREDEAHNLMNDVNAWYVENSYDSVSIISDVTPLLMLPQTKGWYSVEGYSRLLGDAREAARTAGFDTANYDLDIVRHSRVSGFNWNGQSYVGGKGLWLQSSSLGVTVHELGHNFGLMHANFWSATSDSIIGAGSNVEYGNTFDTMGPANAGDYQFNVIWKNTLDWLPARCFHGVTNSGLYRLYAFDVPQLVSSCKYGLRIRKDFDREYWAEFRQRFASNPWTQSGVLLNWDAWDNGAGGSAGGTHLLDTTPGTPVGNSSKDDAAILLGRTFTDPSAGIHLTPLAKGGSAPDTWIDVQVNLGAFPSNLSPVLQLGADAIAVGTNVTVTFTANAADADGDALAYAWDFGDLTFGSNAPTASKKWPGVGDYVVRCVVSDLKGGMASRFVVLRVGSPATYRLTGRIASAANQPLDGVRVHNGLSGGSYRGTYTDSDGNYALANLAASSYALAAVKNGYNLQPAGWANPVEVNANAAGLNWTGTAKPTVTMTPTSLVVGEQSSEMAVVTLSRTGPTDSSLTLNYIVSGTASLGFDYDLSPPLASWPLRVTLPAGVSSTNFVVTPLADVESEGPEAVVLTLAESPDYALGWRPEATVVIADDEAVVPPMVYVFARVRNSQSDDLMIEGSSDTAEFAFQRYGAVAGDLIVHYAVSGSAQNSVDCTPLPGVVTIPVGESVATVSFAAIDDLEVEGDETVQVTVLPDAAYLVDDVRYRSATVTIVDDDPPTVTIVATDSQAVENSSNTGRFTVTRVGSLAANLQVHYTMSGTAIAGVDYGALSGAVLIPAGQATAAITVTPLNDSVVEGSETVLATLLSSPAYNIGNPGEALLTLSDDEWPGVTLSASDATASEPGSDTGSFTFTRTGGAAAPLTVYFDIYGSAVNGADYAAISDQITIPAGTNSAVRVVTLLDDLIRETSETVILVLREDFAYNRNTMSPQTVTLTDNDSGALPGVGFTFATSSSLESQTSVQLGVSLSASSSSTVTVGYAVTGGTAQGEGVDYRLADGTLTFASGQGSRNIVLEVTNDPLAESNETVVVTLHSPQGAVQDALSNHVHSILDDDASGAISVTAVAAAASETGPTPGVFRISRSGATNAPLTVNFQVTGTASSASDYAPLGNSATIPPGSRFVDLPVTPVDDPTPEPAETVVVTLTGALGARLGSPLSAVVQIADNDSAELAPIVSLVASDAIAAESPLNTGEFLITRDRGTNTPLDVSFSIAGSATAGADYEALSDSVTIPIGASSATVLITPRDDSANEGAETIVLTLTILPGCRVTPQAASATVTLFDDETAPPPTILSQPASQIVNVTSNANFSVIATGAPPLVYQWFFNATNALPSATNSTLVLTGLRGTDAGCYSVAVSNWMAVVSSNAELVVNHLPIPSSPRFGRYPAAKLKLLNSVLLGSDPDGDGLFLSAVTTNSVRGGAVKTNTIPGWVWYEAPAGLAEDDSFGYTVADGRGGFSTGTVTVAFVTNAAPTLRLAWEALGDGTVRVTGQGIPGQNFALEFASNLLAPAWQPLGTVELDEFGLFEYVDHAPPGTPARFYRAVSCD